MLRILATVTALAAAVLCHACSPSSRCLENDFDCSALPALLYVRTLTPKYVYTVNQNASGTVSMYSVDWRSGILASLNPSSVAYGSNGGFITFDPSGNFAFVDDVGSNVYTYAISAFTGNLTQTAVTANGPNSNPFVVENTGRFAYGTNNGTTTINIYSYSAASGAVTLISTATNTGATATQTTILDSQGRYLYTSNQTSNNVSQFAVNNTTGALTSLGAAIAATQPGGICIDPQNRWLYATNTGGANVAAFAIGATGALSTISGSPFVAAAAQLSCAVSADGGFLIAAGSGLQVFPINQTTGALGTAVTYTTQGNGVAVDPTGQFVFSPDGAAGTMRSFRWNKLSGTLTLLSTVPAGTNPAGTALLSQYSL